MERPHNVFLRCDPIQVVQHTPVGPIQSSDQHDPVGPTRSSVQHDPVGPTRSSVQHDPMSNTIQCPIRSSVQHKGMSLQLGSCRYSRNAEFYDAIPARGGGSNQQPPCLCGGLLYSFSSVKVNFQFLCLPKIYQHC